MSESNDTVEGEYEEFKMYIFPTAKVSDFGKRSVASLLYDLPQHAIEPKCGRYGTRPRFPFLLFDKTNDRRVASVNEDYANIIAVDTDQARPDGC